jgi:bifunctional DNA-binding transcriptional regulator/antitoxin component of YhaV-PrlF toxin-antitoxin module
MAVTHSQPLTHAVPKVTAQPLAEVPAMESALTGKGQATIPKVFLEYLGFNPHDRLKFLMHSDGSVVLLPK